MLTSPEMIEAFESVLRDRFGLDPVGCRESDDWWRFEVDGVVFQGGVHSADVRVLGLVCAMSASIDIDAVWSDISRATPIGLARFEEADCYIYASAKTGFAEVSAERIEQMIRDCAASAKSPAGSSLRSTWRDWD